MEGEDGGKEAQGVRLGALGQGRSMEVPLLQRADGGRLGIRQMR